MATVRGMTPEAIKALLRKEMGDYQALTEAVSTAKVASENATKEVEDLREKINNADFNIDMSKYDKAMEKYQKDLKELNTSLSEAEKAAIEREKELSKLLLEDVSKKVLTDVSGSLYRIINEFDEMDQRLKKDFTDEAISQRVVEPVVGEIVEYMESDEFEPLQKAKEYADREGGVGEKQLVDASVIAKKLADGAVVQDKIAANAVVSDKIAAEAIVASKLAANAVVAGKIAANAVLAENIAANSITGDHIQANSITANKLTIRPGNLFPDPNFKDECWGTGGAIYAAENNGGELRLIFNGNDNTKAYAPEGDKYPIVVEAGAHYRFSAVVWGSSATPIGASFTLSVLWKDKNSSEVVQRVQVKRGANQISFNFKVPDNLTDKRCTIAFGTDSTQSEGRVSIWNVSLVQASDGNLIVDGSIYARHLTAGSVTTDSMSANSIDGDRIRADTLDANKIRAKSLTSDHVVFKDGFIENAMIKNGTIESGKIKALDAGKITSGTIDADRIGAKTITGDKLVANSITAGEIRADAFIQNGVSLITSTTVNEELIPDWMLASAMYYSKEKHLYYEPLKSLPNGEVIIRPNAKIMLNHAPIRVVNGAEYEIRYSLRCTEGKNAYMQVAFSDSDGELIDIYDGAHPYRIAKNTSKKDSRNRPIFEYADYRIGRVHSPNVVQEQKISDEPRTYVARFKFGEDVTYVNGLNITIYVKDAPGNVKLDGIEVYLADLSIQAIVPNQNEIDAQQDSVINYLKRITDNVAKLVSRNLRATPDMVILSSGGTEWSHFSGLCARLPNYDRRLVLFMPKDWNGFLTVQVMYSNGSVRLNRFTHLDFKQGRASDYKSELHPNYPYSDILRCVYDIPLGNLEYVVIHVHNLMSYETVLKVLSEGDITPDRPIDPSHTVYDPKNPPPWKGNRYQQ